MTFQHQEGRARLFPNRKKEKDTHPDFRGDGMFSGEIVEVAGWRKGDDISLSIKRKAEIADQVQSKFSRHEDEPEPTQGRSLRDELDDEIPF